MTDMEGGAGEEDGCGTWVRSGEGEGEGLTLAAGDGG